MKNLMKFENFSMENNTMMSREEMTKMLCKNGYSVEECNEMTYAEMCNACDGCKDMEMAQTYEAKKYTKRKKSVQTEKKEAQKAQKEADKKIAQAQKALTQAQKERAQAQKALSAQGPKTGQSAKGAQPSEVKTFSQVQKGAQEMTYKQSGLDKPNLADLNKDRKISAYEKSRGKAVQKSIQNQKEKKTTKRK